jgi:hypothetical protein
MRGLCVGQCPLHSHLQVAKAIAGGSAERAMTMNT